MNRFVEKGWECLCRQTFPDAVSGSRRTHITQADFADRIGLSQSYLSAVEHGRNEVDVEVLLVISRKFGGGKCGGRATGW
jgi:DNA-binding XRE family transcriptional regulator